MEFRYVAKNSEELRKLERSIECFEKSYGLDTNGVVYVKPSVFDCVQIYPEKHSSIKEIFPLATNTKPGAKLFKSGPIYAIFDIDGFRFKVDFEPEK